MKLIDNSFYKSNIDTTIIFGSLYLQAKSGNKGSRELFKKLLADKINYFDFCLENALNGEGGNVFYLAVDLLTKEELLEIYNTINPNDQDPELIDKLFDALPTDFVEDYIDWFNRYFTIKKVVDDYADYINDKYHDGTDDVYFGYSIEDPNGTLSLKLDNVTVDIGDAFKCPYDICAQVAYCRYIGAMNGIPEAKEAFIDSITDMSEFDAVVEKKLVLQMAVDLLDGGEIKDVLKSWSCGKVLPDEITADWLLQQYDEYSY